MRSVAEHLRMQRDERRLDSHGFLIVQPNPFMDEVGIEAVAQGDVGDGGTGLGTRLDDLDFERYGTIAYSIIEYKYHFYSFNIYMLRSIVPGFSHRQASL